MFKSKLFLLTLLIALICSPVFAQSSSQAIELKGIIAREDTFASILGVYMDSGNFDVVWSQSGEILYQTNADGVIQAASLDGEYLAVQYNNSIWLVRITTGEELLLLDYGDERAQFSALFTEDDTVFVLSIHRNPTGNWSRKLSHFGMNAMLLGEWDAPDGFDHVEAYDRKNGYVYLQEQDYGGPIAYVDLIGGIYGSVNPSQYEDPRSRTWEYTNIVEGAEVRVSICTINPATSECIPESTREEVRPLEHTELAYIDNPINVVGTPYYVGFGIFSMGFGAPPRTFLIVRDGERFEAAGYTENPPTERLFPFSDLPAFAVNARGEVVLVWGSWATSYQIYKHVVTDLFINPVDMGVDYTTALLPSFERVMAQLNQQG